MKHSDTFNVSGHLEIYKVYENGEEEQVFNEANTITSGMGVGLGLLYAGSGAADITNFQLRYFQIGVGGDERVDNYGVSESHLVSALGQEGGGAGSLLDYSSSPESDIPLASHNLMKWDGSVKATDEGSNTWIFPMISDNAIKRVDLNSVTYILYVDRNSCNNLKEPLNEVGLFMKNPLGTTPYRSQLCAYRPFTDIAKSDDFALVFKWTLNF